MQVRALAEYLLGDTLATKAPLLAYNHFVEALFALNDCQVRAQGNGGITKAGMGACIEGACMQGAVCARPLCGGALCAQHSQARTV